MSSYSTIKITKNKALSYVWLCVSSMHDEDLEVFLNSVLSDRLIRVHIVGDGEENEDSLL